MQRHLTALMMACAKGNSACVRELLRRGARSDLTSADGRTALHYACMGGHADCAKVRLKDKSGASAAAHASLCDYLIHF